MDKNKIYIKGKELITPYYLDKAIKDDKLIGTADPTTSTIGYVGQLFLNTSNNKTFICTAVEEDSYTWENMDSGQTIQYESMPTASADNVGAIVQFTGTTTNIYTNGHFYKCVSDGETPATYSWEEIVFGESEYIINYNAQSSDILAILNAWIGEYHATNKMPKLKMIVSQGDYPREISIEGNLTSTPVNFWSFVDSSQTTSMNHQVNWRQIQASYNPTTKIFSDVRKLYQASSPIYRYVSYYTDGKMALATDNTDSYTPTGNYNPATKKYVDDSISNIPSIGDLDDLTTTAKTDLVSAINEINAKIGDINEVLSRLVTIPEEEQALEDLSNLVDLPEEE